MLNLYLIHEFSINNFSDFFLDILSIASIISGILVIITKNPIVSVLFLICLFSSVSIYLITIGLSFIGLSYLLVYIGAISILFLFILMLINIRISELLSDSNNSISLIILTSVCLYYSLVYVLYNTSLNKISFNNIIFKTHKPTNEYYEPNIISNAFFDTFTNKNGIVYISSNLWDGFLSENSHIASIGNVIYTNYSMWLLLTSIILLLAMVGTIIITIKQNTK